MNHCTCGRTISDNKTACAACVSEPVRSGDGVLEILNVQGGDVKLTFDKNNIQDSIRAKRIVQDMIRRGYAIVVEVERRGKKAYERIKEFDAERGEYIVADFDSLEAAKVDARQSAPIESPPVTLLPGKVPMCDCGKPLNHRGRCPGKANHTRRLPMETTKATGIGRSAGG